MKANKKAIKAIRFKFAETLEGLAGRMGLGSMDESL